MKLTALLSMLVAFVTLVPSAAAQRQFINAPGLHPQGLPFSDAVLVGDTLYLSGNIGVDPKTGKVPDDFVEEARQALKNLGTVLKTANFDYKDVVKVNAFLADMARFNDWNKALPQPSCQSRAFRHNGLRRGCRRFSLASVRSHRRLQSFDNLETPSRQLRHALGQPSA